MAEVRAILDDSLIEVLLFQKAKECKCFMTFTLTRVQYVLENT